MCYLMQYFVRRHVVEDVVLVVACIVVVDVEIVAWKMLVDKVDEHIHGMWLDLVETPEVEPLAVLAVEDQPAEL